MDCFRNSGINDAFLETFMQYFSGNTNSGTSSGSSSTRSGIGGASHPQPRPSQPKVFNDDKERCKFYVEQLQTIYFPDIGAYSAKQLKQACNAMALDCKGFVEAEDYRAALRDRVTSSCPICIDDFEIGSVCKVTYCGHIYHKTCLEQFADTTTADKCPMCYHPINQPSVDVAQVSESNRVADSKKRKRVV